MTVIPTGYAQANFRYEGTGLFYPAEHTCGFDIGGYGGTPTALAQDLFEQWNTDVMPNLTNVVTLTRVSVKFGPDDLGPTGEFNGAAPGGVSTAGASPAVTWLVKKQTAAGGRPNRGRMYVPGVSEAAVGSDGDLADATVLAFQSDITAWATAVAVAGAEPVVLHSEDSPVTIPTPIIAFQVDGIVATQRRRQRR